MCEGICAVVLQFGGLHEWKFPQPKNITPKKFNSGSENLDESFISWSFQDFALALQQVSLTKSKLICPFQPIVPKSHLYCVAIVNGVLHQKNQIQIVSITNTN